MLGSKEGKGKIKEIVREIDADIQREDYENSMNEMRGNDDSYGYDDLDDIDFDGLF